MKNRKYRLEEADYPRPKIIYYIFTLFFRNFWNECKVITALAAIVHGYEIALVRNPRTIPYACAFTYRLDEITFIT
jgi:hypothetical protein